MRTEGPARDLPAAVDLSALRIVQEALTNTVRHAGAGSATCGCEEADSGLVVLGVPGDYGSPRTLGKVAGTVAKTCPQPVVVVKTPV